MGDDPNMQDHHGPKQKPSKEQAKQVRDDKKAQEKK